MNNVKYCGVAIGTHARSLVQEHMDAFIENEHFYEDIPNLLAAVQLARSLVATI